MRKHAITDSMRQFMIYFIVFFACVLLVLTAFSFEDTKTEIRSSTSMYLGSAASSIASVIDWNYIDTFTPGSESRTVIRNYYRSLRQRRPVTRISTGSW